MGDLVLKIWVKVTSVKEQRPESKLGGRLIIQFQGVADVQNPFWGKGDVSYCLLIKP